MIESMREFLCGSAFFGAALTLGTFELGRVIHRKTNFFLFSPLLVSITLCILTLMAFKIPFEEYERGARAVSFFLTPATVCLAVPLHQQFQRLRENWAAVLCGIASGVLANLSLVFLMAAAFKIGHDEYVSILPKSITTAIAFALTEEFGGIVPVTAMMVIVAGNFGNLFAVPVCRIFGIAHPVAKGVAIGTASHALGTARALEIGETEGAMSGLSVALTGLLTVIAAPFFASLI